ncbi:hypothetical protein [Mucilaginibacter sp.]
MDNLNDLKAIWLTAKTDSLPNSREMVQIIRKFRNKKLLGIGGLVLASLFFTAVMIWVVFVYKSSLLTTRIGEACMLVACIILIITNLNSLIRFYKLRVCSNSEFIRFLEQTRARQQFYYEKTQVVAMLFCVTGLLIYMYEGVYQNTILCIVAYALTLIYFAVLWFVVRPRVFKKDGRKITEQIAKLESISKQINE